MESENATEENPFINIHLEFSDRSVYYSRTDYNDPWPILITLTTNTLDIGGIYVLTLLIRVLLKMERNGTDRYLLHYAFSVIIYKISFLIMNNIHYIANVRYRFTFAIFNNVAVAMCLSFLFVNLLALDWYVEFKNDRAHSICIILAYVCGAILWVLGILMLFDLGKIRDFGLDKILSIVYMGFMISSPVFVGTINLVGYRKGKQTESEMYPLIVANYLTFCWLFFAVFVLLLACYEHVSQTLLETFDIFKTFFMFVAWGTPIVVVWYLKRIERYRNGFAEVLKTIQQKDEFLLQNETDDNV